jgi:2-succinyl-6-hydroxy-2,4-cyclohexadiene-1-carboxylate synthase
MIKEVSSWDQKELLNINYTIQGAGQPVILIHGIGASLHDWDVLVPEIVGHGLQAIALDLLGHGESTKPDDPGSYTSESLSYTFECWLNTLNINQPKVLIGHSLGGYISLQYAVKYPQAVRSIILINPFYRSNQLSPILKKINKRPKLSEIAIRCTPLWLIDWILGWDPIKSDRFSSEARYQIAYDYKRAAPYIMHIPGTLPDITTEISQLSIPIMLIWGQKDQTLDPSSFPQLFNILINADGKMIRDAGHQPHIGYPDEVNGWIIDFILTH